MPARKTMPAPKLVTEPTAALAPPPPALSDSETGLLNHLRLIGMQCRASRRADLFEACAALSMDKSTARAAHAEILMRTLGQSMRRAPVLHAPGVAEISFDEAWLIRIARAYVDGDRASATFLLASRVVPHARRNVGFLIAAVTDEFGLT